MSTNRDASATDEARFSHVEFEERAAAIYLDLARRFRDNPELSWFWLGMSMAERQHALVLGFCECQHLINDREPADSSVTCSLSELFRTVENRLAQPGLTVDDAFLIAAELEGSEINAIYERLVRPAEGTSYFTRKKIETLGVNHPQILAQAAQKFGVSATVIEKLTRLASGEPRNGRRP
jgi:hypothetical protein